MMLGLTMPGVAIAQFIPGHTDLNTPVARAAHAWTIAPDGSVLFTWHGDKDGTIRVWDFVEGETRTVVLSGKVAEIRPLGGMPGALVRMEDGRVFSIRADTRHPRLERGDVRSIATSPEGGYAALVEKGSVALYRLNGSGLRGGAWRNYAVPGGATGTAVAADGQEIAIADERGGVTLYGTGTARGVGRTPIRLPSGAVVAEMRYDNSDRWLFLLTRDKQLFYADVRDGSSGGEAVAKPVAKDVQNFDVRRRPDPGSPSPLLIAALTNGRVQVWNEVASGKAVGIDAPRIVGDGARGATFDPWGGGRTQRMFLFSSARGMIELRGMGAGAVGAPALLTLLSTDRDGWAAIDARGRKDGEPRTLQELERAYRQKLRNTDIQLAKLHEACWTPDLLEDVRASGGRSDRPASAPGVPHRCVEAVVPPPIVVTATEPTRDGDGRYTVRVAVQDPAGRATGEAPTLVLSGRVLANALRRDPGGCGKQQGETCWSTSIRAVPGVANTLYAQVAAGSRWVRSDRIEFDVPPDRTPRQPVLHIVTLAVDRYGAAVPCVPAKNFCDLSTPVRGAEGIRGALASALAGHSDFAVDARPLKNDQVTRAQIAALIDDLRRTTYPEDIVWIHIAGHGVPDVRDTGDLYLPNVGDALDGFPADRARSVSVGWIIDHLGELDARTLLVSIDACFAAASETKLREEIDRRYQANGGPLGIHVLFSAYPNQKTNESEGAGNRTAAERPLDSALTAAVIDNLRTATSLTARELFDRVDVRLRTYSCPWGEGACASGHDEDEPMAGARQQRLLAMGSDALLLHRSP